MRDKTSIINTAQKYTARGQIDKAIAEWEKLLVEGKDGNIHNMIGDLHLRKGDEKQAVDCFTRAADIFRKDGFYPKAIAIYKKILNCMPNNVDSLVALAKLDAERGLIGSAVDTYFKAAEIFKRDGASEKALLVVERIIQIAESDIKTRLKIADLYLRMGLREKAANEYVSIASMFSPDNDPEKTREYLLKALSHDSSNISALLGLSAHYDQSGMMEEAIEYLHKAMDISPDSKTVCIQFASLAIKNGKYDEAERALAQLIEKNASDIEAKKLLGALQQKRGHYEEAWENVQPWIDDTIDKQKWTEGIEMLNLFAERYPVPVRERLIRIYLAQHDNEGMVREMMGLAEIYKAEGSYDEALHMYQEALRRQPENQDLRAAMEALDAVTVSLPETTASSATEDVSPEKPPLPEDNLCPPEKLQQEVMPEAQAPDVITEDDLTNRKAEADFYAQQGMIEEAIKLYHHILDSFPENNGIRKAIDALKSLASETDTVSVEKISSSGENWLHPQEQNAGTDPEQSGNGVDGEDYESCYNAGVEYRQKGLLDEAIHSFQIAAKFPETRLLGLRMLASCYMEKGIYELAINEFQKVLDSLKAGDPIYLEMKYELASAYLINEDIAGALKLYNEIQEHHPGFKDVDQKIEKLKNHPAAVGIQSRQKKDRVSYI